MINNLELAMKVLSENTKVLYGVFGVIEDSGYFPPRLFLNEFLMSGSDPCDQDGIMDSWAPLSLSVEEYLNLKVWWIENHPNTIEDSLETYCWEDWTEEVFERVLGE